MTKQGPLEFIAIGHVTIDIINGEIRPGGAAAYAALAAKRLGARVGIVTSFAHDYPFTNCLRSVEKKVIAAKTNTVFKNTYQDGKRYQQMTSIASHIRTEHLMGLNLARDAAVLYCPVTHEIKAPLVSLTPAGICGVAPQGFFRKWDCNGRVSKRKWPEASKALANADFISISQDDTPDAEKLARKLSENIFVITKSAEGSHIFTGSRIYNVAAEKVNVVDETGAGDVFAATFLLFLRQGLSALEAARAATHEAASTIERPGLEALLC